MIDKPLYNLMSSFLPNTNNLRRKKSYEINDIASELSASKTSWKFIVEIKEMVQ